MAKTPDPLDMGFKKTRDIENQKFIDFLLENDPTFREKCTQLGIIDEGGKVFPGIWIPQIEFQQASMKVLTEKETYYNIPLDHVTDSKLKEERQKNKERESEIRKQQEKINKLKDTVVYIASLKASDVPRRGEEEGAGTEDNSVPDDIASKYEVAAMQESRGRKKQLQATLLYAEGASIEDIADTVGWKPDASNVRKMIRLGLELARDKKLPDLSTYLAKHGRQGNTPLS